MRYTRKARRRQRGGATVKKPEPQCQCMDPASGQPCKMVAANGSLFCANHTHCPIAPTNGYEPPYEPDAWNNDPAIYKSMNCYAYAMNFRDPNLVEECRKNNGKDCRQYFPQPGALNGDRYALDASERRNCGVVEKLMMSDVPELEHSTYQDKCPAGKSKIALVVHEKQDYHFYRQNPDGSWSHKDGSNKVKDFDALKRKIMNPAAASRDYRWQGSDLNYRDFCGFYCAPRNHPILLGQGGKRRQSRRSSQRKTQKARKARSGAQTGGVSRRHRHPRSGIAYY